MRVSRHIIFILSILGVAFTSCQKDNLEPPQQAAWMKGDLVAEWNDQWVHLVKNTPGYDLPSSSRAMFFCGMAMYESTLPAMPQYLSLSQSINGLRYNQTFDPNKNISVEIALNRALTHLAHHFFKTAPISVIQEMEQFSVTKKASLLAIYQDEALVRRSEFWGASVAQALIQLDASDPVGHESYMVGAGSFVPANVPQQWVPTPPLFQQAMMPEWYKAQPLGIFASNIEALPPVPYSEDVNSSFYREAMMVYNTHRELTPAQMEMAEFWDDEMSGVTLGSAARWCTVLSNVILDENLNLEQSVLAYVRTGMAGYHATLVAWRAKYTHQQLRPVSYIQTIIDPAFNGYMPATASPEYVAEHAVIAYAAGDVLQETLGEFAFTDRCHSGRLPNRSFTGFMQAAEECSASRLYAGTHFPHSIQEANRLGLQIGDQIMKSVRWKF
jgi:hypothetical protein